MNATSTAPSTKIRKAGYARRAMLDGRNIVMISATSPPSTVKLVTSGMEARPMMSTSTPAGIPGLCTQLTGRHGPVVIRTLLPSLS